MTDSRARPHLGVGKLLFDVVRLKDVIDDLGASEEVSGEVERASRNDRGSY